MPTATEPSGVSGRFAVDLRSDTVTRPTPAMRRAMADAEVGDDGYGEDPTVNALQERFAALLGMEAALFLPSGTMANQIAFRLLGRPGTLVLAGRRQHVVCYEAAGVATTGWAQLTTLDDAGGMLDAGEVVSYVERARHHHPDPSAVFVENTHLQAGGLPWDLERLRAVAGVGLAVHMDGARLFNAVVATGVPAADFAAPVTTVSCCLSKGLGAPAGSLLAGPADVIQAAHAERHRLGGAMRQVGILAAAGLYALDHHVERLADDHARARRLAVAVAERWPGSIDPDAVATNMVVWSHPDPAAVVAHLAEHGVAADTIAPGLLRVVTHLDVDDEGVETACRALATAP